MWSADAPWRPRCPSTAGSDTPERPVVLDLVAPVSLDVEDELQASGLFALTDYRARSVGTLLQRSFSYIADVPGLHSQVLAAVRCIHMLIAEPGYDISHSEPRWRTTIFVSLPDRVDDIGALRLAESIVHEAMHLTLTNWEMAEAFVQSTAAELYSPWRDGPRPPQGVLHGVFVFSCIAAFLSGICTPNENEAAYVRGRLETIERELANVDLQGLWSSLTPLGRSALESWTGRRVNALG